MKSIVTSLLFCAVLIVTVNAASEQKITVTFDNTPLRAALKQFQELSGAAIIFSDTLVAGRVVDHTVSDLTIEQALRLVLKNTGITFQKLAENHFVLIQQKDARITGFVLDADSLTAIPHANVEVIGRGTGVAANDRGYFVLPYRSAAPCSLRVSCVGFESHIVALNQNRVRNPIVVILRPDTLTTPHVIIRAHGDGTDQAETRPSQLSNLPFAGEPDALNTLALLPGIRSAAGRLNGFSISGGSPLQNAVYLDGIPLFRNDNRFRLLGALSPDDLQEIRVLTGGYETRRGGALGGIVELTSKTGNFYEMKGSLSLSPMAGRFALEVPLFSRASWRFSVRHHHSDNYLNAYYDEFFQNPDMTARFQAGDMIDYHPAQPQIDYSFYDVLSKAVISPDDRNAISFTFLTNASEIKQTADTSRAKAYDRNLGLSGRWFREWDGQLSSTLLASYANYRVVETRSNPGLPNSNNHIKSTHVKLDNVWKPKTSSHFMFGGTLKRYELRGQRTDEASFLSFYAQHIWTIMSLLELNYGLRTTHSVKAKHQVLEPRISVLAQLEDTFSITAAWGRYHQYFHQTEALSEMRAGKQPWYISDGRCRPAARADHWQLSLKYLRPGYSLQAALFRRQIYEPQELPAAQQVEGVVHGLSLDLKKQKGNLTGWMNYSQTTRSASLNEALSLSIETPHYFKIVANYQLTQKWCLGSTWQVATTRMDLIEPPVSGSPVIHSLNVSLKKDFKRDLFRGQLRLSIYNLYNHKNPFYKLTPYPEGSHVLTAALTPGLQPSATLKLNF